MDQIKRGSNSIRIRILNLTRDKNDPPMDFDVNSHTTVYELILLLEKKYKTKKIFIFIQPDQPFEGSKDSKLLPILKQKNINEIYYKIIEEEPQLISQQTNNQNQVCFNRHQRVVQNQQPQNLKSQIDAQYQNQFPQNCLPVQQFNNFYENNVNQNSYPMQQQQLNIQIINLKQENIRLEKQIQVEKEENLNQYKENMYLKQVLQNEQLRLQNIDSYTELGKDKTEKKELLKQIKELQDLAQQKSFQYKDIEKKIKEQENEILEQSKKNSEYQNEIQRLTNEFEVRKNNLDNITLQLQKEKENNKELNFKVKELNRDYEGQQKINQELEKKIKAYEQMKQENKVNLDLYAQNEQIIYKNKFINQGKKVKKQQIKELISENIELKLEIKIMQQNTNSNEKQIQELEQQVEDSKKKYRDLQQSQEIQNGNANNTVASLKTDIEKHLKKIQELNNKLYQSQNENHQLKEKLENLIQEQKQNKQKSHASLELKQQQNCFCNIKENLKVLITESLSKKKPAKCNHCFQKISLHTCRELGNLGAEYIDFQCQLDLKNIIEQNRQILLKCSKSDCSFFCFNKPNKVRQLWICPYCNDEQFGGIQQKNFQIEQVQQPQTFKNEKAIKITDNYLDIQSQSQFRNFQPKNPNNKK